MNAINAARRARNLSREQISARTRISPRFIAAIDEGRFSDLPSGLYARAYVRAVAAQVGIDGPELDELLATLAPAPDPLAVLEKVHAPGPSAFRLPPLQFPADVRTHAAALLDAAVLIGITLGVVWTVAVACGLDVRTLVSTAAGPLVVLCGGIWVLYFVLLGGVNGCTLGQFACGLAQRELKPLRLGAIVQRALGIDQADRVRRDDGGPAGLRHSTADPSSPA